MQKREMKQGTIDYWEPLVETIFYEFRSEVSMFSEVSQTDDGISA